MEVLIALRSNRRPALLLLFLLYKFELLSRSFRLRHLLLLLLKVFINEREHRHVILGLECSLELIHLVADVVADLDRPIITDLELLAMPVLQDSLACLVSALDLLAPFLVNLDLCEEHKLLAVVASHADDLEELLQNVRALPRSQDPRALEWTVLLPPGDALLAEELTAVLALHRLLKDL